jgi:rhomboid protease GluP
MISMEKEYYRFLTAVFVHQAPMHLFFNMMALFFLGKPIEYIFGKSRFIMLFIISGLFGTLGSFVFSANAAIGASGAVFGIFGVHAYLFIKNREVYLKWFNKDVIQLLVINIVIGFIIPNIDYWGHFGGLVGGFLVASTFGLSRHVSLVKSVIIGSIISMVIFTSTFFVFNKAYVDYIEYVDDALVELNQAIASEDVDQVISIRDDMLDKKPSFPPIPDDDMYQSINLNIFRLSQ